MKIEERIEKLEKNIKYLIYLIESQAEVLQNQSDVNKALMKYIETFA